ncbi:MAG: type I methionyl aminopeptidase [Clostridia bacterium]|nr:type I methionyl aminopeptidase [Clostridia bacterium]
MIPIKSETDLVKIRRACKVTGDTLKMIEEHIKPGVTTAQLDEIIEKFIREQGCTPSFKNLYGFPASACISVDDVVVHGIPSDKPLEEGQIVSIDVGACYGGFHGDAARTFAVGQITREKQRLIDVTRQSFFEGIKHARAGRRLGDVSHAIQQHVESNGYAIVRAMTGHGIGRRVHEEPNIPNYGQAGCGVMLKSGYTLAIEPMVNAGEFKVLIDQGDKWTCRTVDGSPSAHYENTILVRDGEPEILTL